MGNKVGSLYRYNHSDHKNRLGNCEFKPQDGDLCLCISHSGDCFNNYVVLRKCGNQLYRSVGKFGAYVFDTEITSLSERNFHLVQAGEGIYLSSI